MRLNFYHFSKRSYKIFMKQLLVGLFLFVFSHISAGADLTQQYLIGTWNVVAIQAGKDFSPVVEETKWTINSDGKLLEEIGINGAQRVWQYQLSGSKIAAKYGFISFEWEVLSAQDNEMIVKHHTGVLKLKKGS